MPVGRGVEKDVSRYKNAVRKISSWAFFQNFKLCFFLAKTTFEPEGVRTLNHKIHKQMFYHLHQPRALSDGGCRSDTYLNSLGVHSMRGLYLDLYASGIRVARKLSTARK